jgi:hypothetical protein
MRVTRRETFASNGAQVTTREAPLANRSTCGGWLTLARSSTCLAASPAAGEHRGERLGARCPAKRDLERINGAPDGARPPRYGVFGDVAPSEDGDGGPMDCGGPAESVDCPRGEAQHLGAAALEGCDSAESRNLPVASTRTRLLHFGRIDT